MFQNYYALSIETKKTVSSHKYIFLLKYYFQIKIN